MEVTMEPRERRRWLSARYADRCRRVRIRIESSCAYYISEREWENAWCLAPFGRLRKGKSVGCNCRHRAHGNPKFGVGICVHGDYRPVVVVRIAGRRLCHRWLRALREGIEPDDVSL